MTSASRANKLRGTREWKAANKEHVAAYNKQWYANNSDRSLKLNQAWRSRNRSLRNAQLRKRYKTDARYRIEIGLRTRIHTVLRRRMLLGYKSASSMTLVGCSVDDLMRHIESLFLPGMRWDNHGEWHVDHKRPCASFDLLDPKQQRACFHYTNLQPLWAVDNLKKHARTENICR